MATQQQADLAMAPSPLDPLYYAMLVTRASPDFSPI